MCDPATAIMTAAAIGGAYLQYEETKSAANRQEQILKEGQNLENARLRAMMEQTNQNAQEAMGTRHKEAIQEEGRLRAIGSESGLFGTSYDRGMAMQEQNANADISAIESGRLRANDQTAMEGAASAIQYKNQMNGIRRPSKLGLGLQIAGMGAQGYSQGQARAQANEQAAKSRKTP